MLTHELRFTEDGPTEFRKVKLHPPSPYQLNVNRILSLRDTLDWMMSNISDGEREVLNTLRYTMRDFEVDGNVYEIVKLEDDLRDKYPVTLNNLMSLREEIGRDRI